MRRLPVLVAIVVLSLGAGGLLLWAPHWTPPRASFPVQGIDVSGHQGPIGWSELRQQGVNFAYIKATEGGDFRDRRFAENWAGAAHVGIRRGAYHFFTLCRSGAEQAGNFLATVPSDADALPAAVDLEFLGNCRSADRMSQLQLQKELAAFLRVVEARTKEPTLLYLTKEFDDAYGVSRAFDRPLWLRRIVLKPNFGARPWAVWQASNFRHLDGIRGRVDWNVSRLTWPAHPPHSQP